MEVNRKLDGRMVRRLQGLFRVQDGTDSLHKVASVGLLRLEGSGGLHSEEVMIPMELMDG